MIHQASVSIHRNNRAALPVQHVQQFDAMAPVPGRQQVGQIECMVGPPVAERSLPAPCFHHGMGIHEHTYQVGMRAGFAVYPERRDPRALDGSARDMRPLLNENAQQTRRIRQLGPGAHVVAVQV